MNDLSLQNFTSIFEIFFGYHILNAFSEKIRNLLNVNLHVSGLVNNHAECNRYKTYLESKAGSKKIFLFTWLSKVFIKSIERSKCRFLDDKLFKILKSSYIYFGLLSLTFLFLAGIIDIVQDDSHLMLINLVSTVVAVFYLIFSFRTSNHKIKWGSVRVFFTSTLLFFIIIIIPEKTIASYSFIPTISINLFNWFKIEQYRSVLVFWSICLVFTPILIEILHIFLCVFQLKFLKYFTYLSFYINEIFFSVTTLRKLKKDTSNFKDLEDFNP